VLSNAYESLEAAYRVLRETERAQYPTATEVELRLLSHVLRLHQYDVDISQACQKVEISAAEGLRLLQLPAHRAQVKEWRKC